ncbi:MAG: HNH endonuclease [Nakamurella sp.]
MEQGALSLDLRREACRPAAAAMYGVRSVLYQAGNADLARIAAELAELRAMAGAALVAVIAEAESRGIVTDSQFASTASWVADSAWHCRREAHTLAKAAGILRRVELSPLTDSILEADLDAGTAVAVASEFDRLAPDLAADAAPAVLEQFASVAAEHGPRAARQLREYLLARYGAEGHFEDHQERCRRHIDLSSGRQTIAGLWDYRLTLDAEGRAVMEAAIGPLSAPRPDADGGTPDRRPVARRRGAALIEALRRSTVATGHISASPKAVLSITMDFADLVESVSSGTALGSLAGRRTPGQGTLLAPDTIRKVACDAHIIPVVLGGHGELLEQGRAERLFTPGQVRALWLRDRQCTFPGCDIPAAWCDAHHLVHWADGGATDLDNGALLCPRHHTIVHRDRMAGAVAGSAVVWDQRPNSYRTTISSVEQSPAAQDAQFCIAESAPKHRTYARRNHTKQTQEKQTDAPWPPPRRLRPSGHNEGELHTQIRTGHTVDTAHHVPSPGSRVLRT